MVEKVSWMLCQTFLTWHSTKTRVLSWNENDLKHWQRWIWRNRSSFIWREISRMQLKAKNSWKKKSPDWGLSHDVCSFVNSSPLRQQMEAHASENERGTGYGIFDESPAVLKEKVNIIPFPLDLILQIRNLEVELRIAKKNDGSGASFGQGSSSENSSLEERILILEVRISRRDVINHHSFCSLRMKICSGPRRRGTTSSYNFSYHFVGKTVFWPHVDNWLKPKLNWERLVSNMPIFPPYLILTVSSLDETERSNRGAVNNDKFKEMEQQVHHSCVCLLINHHNLYSWLWRITLSNIWKLFWWKVKPN